MSAENENKDIEDMRLLMKPRFYFIVLIYFV